MMNKLKNTIFVALLAALFITSCDWDFAIGSSYKTFAYDLRGTWVSNDPSVYSGELVIDIDRITIKGYREDQTPFLDNDSKRPFRAYPKGVALKGYSEDGKIFIEDGGLLQEGIPYTYYTAGNFSQEKLLRFTFWDRPEILQKQ
jgi:hypothetical protein